MSHPHGQCSSGFSEPFQLAPRKRARATDLLSGKAVLSSIAAVDKANRRRLETRATAGREGFGTHLNREDFRKHRRVRRGGQGRGGLDRPHQ